MVSHHAVTRQITLNRMSTQTTPELRRELVFRPYIYMYIHMYTHTAPNLLAMFVAQNSRPYTLYFQHIEWPYHIPP